MRRTAAKTGMRHAAGGTTPKPAGTLDDVAVFVAVAELASFAEASRRLAIPTSSVSRAVARLEDDLGLPLLRRTSRAVALTDDGRALLERAAGHVAGLREALALAAERHPEPSGRVRVTAPAFTGSTRVARALADFAARYPGIAVEIDASNVLRDLLKGGFDFGIRVGPDVDADFVARPLWRGEFGLFASEGFVRRALDGEPRVTREALERGPCVVMRPGTVWRFVDRAGATVEVTPRPSFAVNDPRGAVDVARRGLGITLAPVDAVPADAPDLVALEADFGRPQGMELFVVYPSRRLLPARARMAIEWLATWTGR